MADCTCSEWVADLPDCVHYHVYYHVHHHESVHFSAHVLAAMAAYQSQILKVLGGLYDLGVGSASLLACLGLGQ
jgi:hypothetical protein